jgi:hypothetical protein
MLLVRNNLAISVAIWATLNASVGCRAPWSSADDSLSSNKPAGATVAATDETQPVPPVDRMAATPPATDQPLPAAPSNSDLAGMLEKLDQVEAIDPAAKRQLLAELERTEPKFWPAVAEQFRASLAYHQELASMPAKIGASNPAAGEPQWQTSVDSSPPAHPYASTSDPMNRPSAPIGALADPRRAEDNQISSEVLAQSTPYTPRVPVEESASSSTPPDLAVPAQFVSQSPTAAAATASSLTISDDASAASLSIANAGGALAAAANPPTSAAGANASTSQSPSTPNWQALIVQAAENLSGRVAESPATTAEIHQHVSLRMLRLLAGQTESALEPIPNISPVEQDYWSRQLFALATYLDHHSQPDNTRRAAASVTHLDEAVANLRDLGALSVRNLTFCKEIYGYGAVAPYPDDRFSPGEEVSLYVEVENYHSRSTENGFTTSLSSTYEILDEKNERIDGGEFPIVDDCCRTRRRDFHIQFGLTLPEKIAPGKYQFRLVVRDRQSDKIANATAAFEIRAK